MNTKLKFTLIGLIAICIVSIAFNVFLCSRKASGANEMLSTENVRKTADSLKIIELRDSTTKLLTQVKSLSSDKSDNTTEMSQLRDKLAKVENDLKGLQKKLQESESLKEEYYAEIQRLIREIDYAVTGSDGKPRPAKYIKVNAKYREKKKQ